MIEILAGLPNNVLGLVVKGRVTKKDCSGVLLPAVQKALKWQRRLRLYYEIRSRYPGALWEEINLGIEHAPLWERVAVVTDVVWIRYTVQALHLLIPGEIRVFATSQTPEGLAWITDASRPKRPRLTAPAMPSVNRGRRSFRPPVQCLHRAL
jgi:hypothetical protein